MKIHELSRLRYSLVIEATEDPNFFGFYSQDLVGFSGVGHSVEDCLYKAKFGMEEHVEVMQNEGLSVPRPSFNPQVVIQNSPRFKGAAARNN